MRTLAPFVKKVALLVALATSAGAAPLQARSPADDPEVKAQIALFSAWVEGQIAIRGLPGVVVDVVSGQDLIWARGFGHADVEADRPMETDTRFRMASHSKLFTATAIMQLREQGKVRLDDPVTDYLRWFAFRRAAPDDPPVTIEHFVDAQLRLAP
jgi:CubicO group peptidase (beta-lactamase class C family)